MCYSLPGPRCSRHALQRLAKAESNLDTAREAKNKAEMALEVASDSLDKAKVQKELARAEKDITTAENRLNGAQNNYKRSVTERDKSLKDYRTRAEELKKAQEDYDLSPAGIEEMRTGVVTRLDDKGKAVPTGDKRPVDIKKAVESEIVRKERIEAAKSPDPLDGLSQDDLMEMARDTNDSAVTARLFAKDPETYDYLTSNPATTAEVLHGIYHYAPAKYNIYAMRNVAQHPNTADETLYGITDQYKANRYGVIDAIIQNGNVSDKTLELISNRKQEKISATSIRKIDERLGTETPSWGVLSKRRLDKMTSLGGRPHDGNSSRLVAFDAEQMFKLAGGKAQSDDSGNPSNFEIGGIKISDDRVREFSRVTYFDAIKGNWKLTEDKEVDDILRPALEKRFE